MVQHVLWRGSTRNIKDAIPRPAGVTHERHSRDLDLVFFQLFVEFMLNNPIGVSDCPGIRSRTVTRTPSDPSGPGGGHPSRPQDPAAPPLTTASRRHLERPRPAGRLRVTTTCHHRPTQPVTVPPGCVCRAGRGQGSHDEPFRGCPRPPRAIWG